MEKFEPTIESEEKDNYSDIESVSELEMKNLRLNFESENEISKITEKVKDTIEQIDIYNELAESEKERFVSGLAWSMKGKALGDFLSSIADNDSITEDDKYELSQEVYQRSWNMDLEQFVKGQSGLYFSQSDIQINPDTGKFYADEIRESVKRRRSNAYEEFLKALDLTN